MWIPLIKIQKKFFFTVQLFYPQRLCVIICSYVFAIKISFFLFLIFFAFSLFLFSFCIVWNYWIFLSKMKVVIVALLYYYCSFVCIIYCSFLVFVIEHQSHLRILHWKMVYKERQLIIFVQWQIQNFVSHNCCTPSSSSSSSCCCWIFRLFAKWMNGWLFLIRQRRLLF